MSLFSIALVLFLIMDPLGNIAPINTMLTAVEPKRQNWVILREMLFALGFILFFALLGEVLFIFLEINDITVSIAAGMILFLAAVQILFPSLNSLRLRVPKEEPYITPLAIPLIAGPALLATTMLYAKLQHSHIIMLGAVLISWTLALIITLSSRRIHKLIGNNGVLGIEKLMGMVLVLLATQRFVDGIKLFINKVIS
ncbi:MAG: MarC family protein [Waddliaceae bacterium]